MRIAAVAEIHGNVVAFEAVVADMDRFRPDLVVVAGDLTLGDPDDAEVLQQVAALQHVAVRGNHDELVVDGPRRGSTNHPILPLAKRARESLSAAQRSYLRALPDHRFIDVAAGSDVCLAHATPGSVRKGVFSHAGREPEVEAEVDERYTMKPSALRTLFHGAGFNLLITGHTHVQFHRNPEGVDVVNPGPVNGRSWPTTPCWTISPPVARGDSSFVRWTTT